MLGIRTTTGLTALGMILTATLFNGVAWIIALFFFPHDNPAAILHYSVGVGIDFIGEGSHILTLPMVGSILLIGNSLLDLMLRSATREGMWLLLAINPWLQVIVLTAVLLLWQQNV